MSIEDLLKPRYKVIADYPNSPYEIGDLLTNNGSFLITITHFWDEWGELQKQKNFHEESDVLKYPHLFKKLKWWEERTPEEIGYVCFNTDTHYLKGKVIRVLGDGWGNTTLRVDNAKFDLYPKYCTPITEEEYLTYQNTTIQ